MAEFPLEAEVDAVHKAVMAMDNAQWLPDADDPRDLDPDDDLIGEMWTAIYMLEEATEGLRRGLGRECDRRNAVLDNMTLAEFDAWEASIDAGS